jgi:hypothetical protein
MLKFEAVEQKTKTYKTNLDPVTAVYCHSRRKRIEDVPGVYHVYFKGDVMFTTVKIKHEGTYAPEILDEIRDVIDGIKEN